MKIFIISLATGVIITLIIAYTTSAYSDRIQNGIAREVIRLHVLPNSDNESDQQLKFLVRDGILDFFNNKMNGKTNKNESREILLNNLPMIQELAERIIISNGYNHSVSVNYGQSFFPTRLYGHLAFPAGNYEALNVKIGEGTGLNWWCIMFPPLCFVDITGGVVADSNILRDVLSDEEYDIVTNGASDEQIPIMIRFRIIEWWQERRR